MHTELFDYEDTVEATPAAPVKKPLSMPFKLLIAAAIIVIALNIFNACSVRSEDARLSQQAEEIFKQREEQERAQSTVKVENPAAQPQSTTTPHVEEKTEEEKTNEANEKAMRGTKAGQLNIGPAVTDIPYNRKLQFGDWADTDHNGCDARNDILNRDLENVVQGKVPGCPKAGVMSGTLHDPYTGKTIDFVRGPQTSSAVQVDHIIPLKYAWEHGAWDWTQELRETYANDPEVLVASEGSANMAKGAKGPSLWMPENKAYQCEYANHWVNIANKYHLTIAQEDAYVIYDVLLNCE